MLRNRMLMTKNRMLMGYRMRMPLYLVCSCGFIVCASKFIRPGYREWRQTASEEILSMLSLKSNMRFGRIYSED